MQTAPPVGDDCVAPHLEGKRRGYGECKCRHHRWLHNEYQKAWKKRAKNTDRPHYFNRGPKWVIGHNALDGTPLFDAIRNAGMAVHFDKSKTHQTHQHPDIMHELRRAFDRGRRDGTPPVIPLHDADRACIKILGVHPYDVFGEAIFQLETGEPRW